jgi:outer membrane receptor protein involved in Fe transport
MLTRRDRSFKIRFLSLNLVWALALAFAAPAQNADPSGPCDEPCPAEVSDDTAPESLGVFEVLGELRSDVQPLRPEQTPGGDSLTMGGLLRSGRSVSFTGDAGEYREPRVRGAGFGLTQLTFDDRVLPAQSRDPSNDRVLSVGLFPSALFQSAEVSTDSDAAGGIAGTVELRFWPDRAPEQLRATLGTHVSTDESEFTPFLSLRTPFARSDNHWGSFVLAYQNIRNPKTQHGRLFDETGLIEQKDEQNTLDLVSGGLTLFFKQELGDNGNLEIGLLHLFAEEDETEIATFQEFPEDETTMQREDLSYDQNISGLSVAWDLTRGTAEHRFSLSFDDADFEQALVTNLEEASLTGGGDEDLARAAYDGVFNVSESVLEFQLSWSRRQRNESQSLNGEPAFSYTIEETIIAPDFRWNRAFASVTAELGLRIEDWDVDSLDTSSNNTEFLPFGKLLVPVGDGDARFTIAAGRTLARPSLADLTPVLRPDQPDEDQATIGNPTLIATTANGIDIAFESTVSGVGYRVNGFYRDLKDIVELVQLESDLFTPDNTGDGSLSGIELSFWGEPGHGPRWMVNYSYLRSSITNRQTGAKRRINDQPDFVLNGEIELPLGERAGAGLRLFAQGDAQRSFLDERVAIEYDANIDLFFRYSLRRDWRLEAGVTNLLGTERRQNTLFLDEGEPVAREAERENSDPSISLWFSGSW